MGEISNMILDGVLCHECGSFVESCLTKRGDILPLGLPSLCDECFKKKKDKESELLL